MAWHQIRRLGWSGSDSALNEPAWRWLAQAFGMPALLATPASALTGITLPPPRLAAREQLIALLGPSGVRQDDAERARHATGGGLADLLRRRAGDVAAAPDAVLYPRTEDDVLAVLKLCATLGVAVVPFGGGAGDVAPARGDHAAVVTLDISGLNRVIAIDMMSGLADAEAGITGAELERQLAARSMTPGQQSGDFESATLGGRIAQGGEDCDWLHHLRVATPQGLLTGEAPGLGLTQLMRGSHGALGVITRATIRLNTLPAKEDYRGYLFPDFASGLAAVREARRTGVPQSLMRLSDDGETRLSRALARAGHGWDIPERIFDAWLAFRRFNGDAAQLLAGFSGSEDQIRAARKKFDAIAKRLGALALGVHTGGRQPHFATLRDALLDRGCGMDRLEIPVSWSQLPSLYVAGRAALKQAMRAQAPLPGAHGLVQAHVGSPSPDGARLTFSWLYPRKLEDEIAQAESIRRALLAAIAARSGSIDELQRDVLRSVKQALDPKRILNPGKPF